MHLRNILFIVKFPTNCGQECFLKHTKPWSIRLSKQKPMVIIYQWNSAPLNSGNMYR